MKMKNLDVRKLERNVIQFKVEDMELMERRKKKDEKIKKKEKKKRKKMRGRSRRGNRKEKY
jgi:hypothetical protein